MVSPHERRRLLAGLVTGLLLALASLPGLATPSSASAGAAPDDEEYDAPLDVSIDALTPGVLPSKGPLVVSGTVTNRDLATWRDIDLFPMMNAGPDCAVAPCPAVMTTADELAVAAETDPTAPIGARYLEVMAEVAVLEPGQTQAFTLRLSRADLDRLVPTPTTGVYWFGVHALGASEQQPADSVADGRARTFLPAVADDGVTDGLSARVPTAVVVPLRGRIAHDTDGELGRALAWQESLGPDGDLGGALAFGAASQDAPMTWLLDPALPDAVAQLAAGNPTRAITPVPTADEENEGEEGDDDESPSESGSPSDDAGSDGGEDTPAGGQPTMPEDSPVISAAAAWLSRAPAALGQDAVSLLPYGDIDVAAAAAWLPRLYEVARSQPASTLATWGLTGSPVVGSPNGYLDSLAIESVDDGAAILLGDRSLPQETYGDRAPVGATIGESPVVITSHAAAQGGPGPDDPQAPVAVRQRILSEAVTRLLRAEDAPPEPLVVVLPTGIDAAGAAGFWAGLSDDAADDLIRLTDLAGVLALPASGADGATEEIDPDDLDYPAAQQEAELNGSVLAEANRLLDASASLQGLLGDSYTIGTELTGEVLVGTSYAVRTDRDAGPRLGRTYDWVAEQLAAVTIDAPAGVTLSSDSGSFNVAVGNGLDFPISVQIEVSADSGATIEAANPIVLAPNSRTSVPISARLDGTGVRNVTLRLTDPEGHPIGAEDSLPIRSGQVGVVIWVIIGTGAAILFVAIGVRLYRRVRGRGRQDPA